MASNIYNEVVKHVGTMPNNKILCFLFQYVLDRLSQFGYYHHKPQTIKIQKTYGKKQSANSLNCTITDRMILQHSISDSKHTNEFTSKSNNQNIETSQILLP